MASLFLEEGWENPSHGILHASGVCQSCCGAWDPHISDSCFPLPEEHLDTRVLPQRSKALGGVGATQARAPANDRFAAEALAEGGTGLEVNCCETCDLIAVDPRTVSRA